MIGETEFEEILKKYDFEMSNGDSVFGFYPDESTLCENIEDLEKCLQNIAAQRKKLLVNEKIKKINKLFK